MGLGFVIVGLPALLFSVCLIGQCRNFFMNFARRTVDEKFIFFSNAAFFLGLFIFVFFVLPKLIF